MSSYVMGRHHLMHCRWLGVDRIFLRENTQEPHVSKKFTTHLQDLIDIGFLDLGTWGGKSPEAQQMWYNKCTEKELGGQYAWILFSDLDEYPVLMNGCALPSTLFTICTQLCSVRGHAI